MTSPATAPAFSGACLAALFEPLGVPFGCVTFYGADVAGLGFGAERVDVPDGRGGIGAPFEEDGVADWPLGFVACAGVVAFSFFAVSTAELSL